jgi:hypothetical protein
MKNELNATILPAHIHRKDGRGRYTSSKTVCVTAVLSALGIDPERFHSTSTARNVDAYEGVIRRRGFALRSRRSSFPRKVTVGGLRDGIRRLDDPDGTLYLVRIRAHVLLLDAEGRTVVDTAPRRSDRRAVVKVHAVWPKWPRLVQIKNT